MSDSKEIRISIDLTTRQNQQLWAEISKFKPRERNKLIVDAMAQYFIYNPYDQSLREDKSDSSVTSSDQEIRLMLGEVMKRLESLEKRTSGDNTAPAEEKEVHKEEIRFEAHKGDKVEGVNSIQPEVENDNVEADVREATGNLHTEASTGIPDEVMAMLMSMQAE